MAAAAKVVSTGVTTYATSVTRTEQAQVAAWPTRTCLALAILLLSCVFRCDPLIYCRSKRSRNVGTQSHTTYTAVRNAAGPRFWPLEDAQHGAWSNDMKLGPDRVLYGNPGRYRK